MDVSFLVERLVAIGALLLASAFFAGSETALFSLTRVQREAMATREDRASRRLSEMLSHPRRLIVTIIVCNELINITNSSVAATLVAWAFPGVREIGQVVIATCVMLPLILFIGEMTPKSLALRLSERWARIVSAPLQTLAYFITPLRVILQSVASAVLTIIGARPMTLEEGLREEEFRSLVDVGSEEGELQVAERRLIHNVFEFGDTTVGKVMTPAEKVFALPYEMPLSRMVEQIAGRALFARAHLQDAEGDAARRRRQAAGARGDGSRRRAVGEGSQRLLVGRARGAHGAGSVAPGAVRAAHDQVRSALPRVPAQAHARGARRRRVRAAGRAGDDGGPSRGAVRRDRRREGDALT